MTMDNGDRAAFAYPGIWHPALERFLDNGATGLTKREYFAAMAMQGMCALQDDRYWHKSCGMTPEEWQADIIARDAAHAVRTADALLAELAKEQNNG